MRFVERLCTSQSLPAGPLDEAFCALQAVPAPPMPPAPSVPSVAPARHAPRALQDAAG